jgi:hypothetical protein
VQAALNAYNALSAGAQALLTTEKDLLDDLKTKIDSFGSATDSKIDISFWVNASDSSILSSAATATIYKTNTGESRPASFTASVSGAYATVAWYVDAVEKGTGAITINAADYRVGTHRLNVRVTTDGKPYSTEITFTVAN